MSLSYAQKLKPICISLKAQYVDVLCVNRYYAWYSDCSHTELIQRQLTYDLNGWHSRFNKPVIITEYGADTVAGFHQVYNSTYYFGLFFSFCFSEVWEIKTCVSICLSVPRFVHMSVAKTWTCIISSIVLMISLWYLACMILVISPFNGHHVVTLTYIKVKFAALGTTKFSKFACIHCTHC